jgi:menaquinone-dependent protoporphyrinogen oxidase
MSRILVIYGTTNGQAGRIARFIAETIQSAGLEVDVVDAAISDPDPASYRATIVVASIHAGGYQRSVERWVKRWGTRLAVSSTAFVSVCLGVLQHDAKVDQDLASILRRFRSATGWEPGVTKLVAGALSYTQYGWVTRLVMRRIARKAGGSTDTTRDHEYTDWNDLRSFSQEFARTVMARSEPPATGPNQPRPAAERRHG